MSTQEHDAVNGGVDGDDNADSLRATYAGAKCRIATLEQQLKTMKEAGTKRKLYVLSPLPYVLILIEEVETRCLQPLKGE